jgi:hypothetical protein
LKAGKGYALNSLSILVSVGSFVMVFGLKYCIDLNGKLKDSNPWTNQTGICQLLIINPGQIYLFYRELQTEKYLCSNFL